MSDTCDLVWLIKCSVTEANWHASLIRPHCRYGPECCRRPDFYNESVIVDIKFGGNRNIPRISVLEQVKDVFLILLRIRALPFPLRTADRKDAIAASNCFSNQKVLAMSDAGGNGTYLTARLVKYPLKLHSNQPKSLKIIVETRRKLGN